VGIGRSINLALGTSWCIIKLNVPVTELGMSISSPEGQTLTHVISPARQVLGTVDQDNTAQEEGTESGQAEPDQIDLLYDADDAFNIFSDPNDRDTSNSHRSSDFLTPDSQTEGITVIHDSDEITLPDLTPHQVSQAEKANNISSWIQGSQDTIPTPILHPGNDPAPPDETMATTEVSGFTTLSHLSQETVTWFNDPSIPPHLQGKLLSVEHYDMWMHSISTLA
jgi:hypothetical protein